MTSIRSQEQLVRQNELAARKSVHTQPPHFKTRGLSQRRGACTLTFGTLCSFQGAEHAPSPNTLPQAHARRQLSNQIGGRTNRGPKGCGAKEDSRSSRSSCQPEPQLEGRIRHASCLAAPERNTGRGPPGLSRLSPCGGESERGRRTFSSTHRCPKRRHRYGEEGKRFRGDLLSHTVARAVPSALEGLTSGFGMGPGVPPPP
jgi:hypothetical protein